MPKKYHITPKPAAPRFIPVGRSGIIDWEEDCLKCGSCVKKRCLYHVYQDRSYDFRTMVDSIDYMCKNCFSCIQNCPRGVLSKTINPEFLKMGDEYWKPEIILTTWFQAETGKIPVSGAGYRGPFSGPGFDSMWTDMSEIVRPTRDGIHGREYISTTIDIGRKMDRLEFDASGAVEVNIPPLVEIHLPVLFNLLPFGNLGNGVSLSMVRAAKQVEALAYVAAGDYDASFEPYRAHLIPLSTQQGADIPADLLEYVPMVELIHAPNVMDSVRRLKAAYPAKVVSVRVPLDGPARDITLDLTRAGVEVVHLCADAHGNVAGNDGESRFVKDVLRDVHTHLVTEGVRDEVTLLVSGGVALAEHVPKAIICGADGVAIDLPLLVGLECRLCKRCVEGKSCPVELEKLDAEYGSQRLVNLMCAWWSQLIEVMGAMGIRDVRRVRGEAGRAMFFEDLERDTFGAMFGEKE
jgi:ferredoxin